MNATHQSADAPWHEMVGVGLAEPLMLAVPMLVVDELDNLKDRGSAKQQERARSALKYLYGLLGEQPAVTATVAAGGTDTGAVRIRLMPDPYRHRRLPRHDDELVERARSLRRFVERQTHFVTYDAGAAFRAQLAGLTAHRLGQS